MDKLKKLKLREVKSNFEKLSEKSLSVLFGGYEQGTGGASCGQTGSSCGCDGTAVCNCKPIQKPKE